MGLNYIFNLAPCGRASTFSAIHWCEFTNFLLHQDQTVEAFYSELVVTFKKSVWFVLWHEIEPLIEAKMDPCFHMSHQKLRLINIFPIFLLSKFGKPLWTAASVSCCQQTELSPRGGSSAALALLLQGSMCCVFRDALTLVVTSGYLTSSFSSDIWLHSKNCCSLDIFFSAHAW